MQIRICQQAWRLWRVPFFFHSLNKQAASAASTCVPNATDGRTALVVCSLWLVQWKSKRTPRQQKWGANCARLPALWDDHTSRWRPQLLLLASNAAGRMSCVTTGAMPLGVCAAMRERDGLLLICSLGHASTGNQFYLIEEHRFHAPIGRLKIGSFCRGQTARFRKLAVSC